MTTRPRYELTAADILDHRVWRSKGGMTGHGGPHAEHLSCPYIIMSPSDGLIIVWSQGRPVAASYRPEVACAMLWNERLEPGWCEAASDPTLNPEEALLDPLSRREARIRAHTLAANARQRAAEAELAARRRRTQLIDPVSVKPTAELTLDDLLS